MIWVDFREWLIIATNIIQIGMLVCVIYWQRSIYRAIIGLGRIEHHIEHQHVIVEEDMAKER